MELWYNNVGVGDVVGGNVMLITETVISKVIKNVINLINIVVCQAQASRTQLHPPIWTH